MHDMTRSARAKNNTANRVIQKRVEMDDSSIINAFKHMQLPLMIVGSDGTVIHCNVGTDRLFGYDDGDLIGRRVFDVLPVSSLSELNAFITPPANDVTIKDMIGQKQSGDPVRLAIHLTAWIDADHGQQHALVLRDITDEVEAGRSITQQLSLANRAIASAGIGVFEFDLPKNWINGSAAWRALMDLADDDTMDVRDAWNERVHPDDREETAAKVVACIEDPTQTRCVYEFRLKSKDGLAWNWRRTDLTVTHRDKDGRATNFIGATVDINEQKAVAQTLAQNAEQFRMVFETSPVCKVIVDNDRKIIRVNSAFSALFGYTAAAMTGTTLLDITHPDDLHIGTSDLKRIQSGEALSYQVEKRYIRANGAVMWGLLTVGVLDHANGEPDHYICQVVDVTERQRLEEFRNKFVSTVSHELRTPLTSVLGSLSLLSSMNDEPFSIEAQRLLYIAQENGNRLHALVNDILDFEKSSAQQMRFTLSEHQIIGLVEDAVLTNMVFAEKFDVRFQVECADRSLIATVDPKRFQQVMGNLLTNAAKFAEESSTVDVRVEDAVGSIRISIANDGDGIPDDFRGDIFKPFAQASGRKTDMRRGSGLGLNITKQILEQTGGTIGYESEKDGRTTFWFTVPVQVPE